MYFFWEKKKLREIYEKKTSYNMCEQNKIVNSFRGLVTEKGGRNEEMESYC